MALLEQQAPLVRKAQSDKLARLVLMEQKVIKATPAHKAQSDKQVRQEQQDHKVQLVLPEQKAIKETPAQLARPEQLD